MDMLYCFPPGNLPEEQRALATLGRTYYVHSQSELHEREGSSTNINTLLTRAEDHYQKALNVCVKLVGELSDRELLEMRSRLYLNLGLVYEDKRDLAGARGFMKKALDIAK